MSGESPEPRPPTGVDATLVVQYCPFCGEMAGSFWARHSDEGHWCEACQLFFSVTVADDAPA